MDKLKQLMSLCKCSVTLTVNDHRDCYQTAAQFFEERSAYNTIHESVDPEVMRLMIERDTIIELQFYPATPIGSYTVYHYDLDAALDEALACFEV